MTGHDWWRVSSPPGPLGLAKLGRLARRFVGIAGPNPEVPIIPLGNRVAEAIHRLWPTACACSLVGGVSAWLMSWVGGLETSRMALRIVLGALAGGLAGSASAMLLRVIENHLRGAARRQSGPADLWDAWLDDDDSERRNPATEGDEADPPWEMASAPAVVRPRVLSREGASFCLEGEILPFAEAGERGAIWISGPPGSGKTTALRHLAAVLPPEYGVRVLDEPDRATLANHSGAGLVVYTSETPVLPKHLASYRLAPWGDDERIEYLLGAARGRCASVMARLKGLDNRSPIEGIPELWRVVLDRMIDDETLAGVRPALRQELAPSLANDDLREHAQAHSLASLAVPMPVPPENRGGIEWCPQDSPLLKLIRHRSIQILVAADRIAADLGNVDAPCKFLAERLPLDLVREVGLLIGDLTNATDRLKSILASIDERLHPMAASLLHATPKGWRPGTGHPPRLTGAYLDRVEWPLVQLKAAVMVGVDMDRGNLPGALLDLAVASRARLRRVNLRGASLVGFRANEADLSHANLSSVRAEGATFQAANLEGARLDNSSMQAAGFELAKLTEARLINADLTGAKLEAAIIDGADFSGAILESAVLQSLTLSRANFAGASFAGANLFGCNLEGMELRAANFQGACLQDALLTNSIMPNANFRGANLRGAGLAEVEWEGACLAGADLQGASFHMGSSRSGLVNSPIASEGTRTGFYTDDFNEQDFKSPEEIRKANLRGADLRGAKISGVDFYLVDLRGATIDPGQAEHLRRSGAILVDRA